MSETTRPIESPRLELLRKLWADGGLVIGSAAEEVAGVSRDTIRRVLNGHLARSGTYEKISNATGIRGWPGQEGAP